MLRVSMIIVLLLSVRHTVAMDVETVLSKLREQYLGTESIEYETQYELFKDHKSNDVHTAYTGYVYRTKGMMYQRIHTTEFVYGSDYFLKINSDEHLMFWGQKPETLNMEVDLAAVLKECERKTLNETADYYTVTLWLKNGSSVPLSLLKIRVDKTHFRPLQLDLYYSVHQNFSKDYRKQDMQQPHLRIRFDNIRVKPEKKQYLLEFSRYISTEKGMHSPSTKYKDFELIDGRI